jgi:thiol-disulfide isomerase/thioredoxin
MKTKSCIFFFVMLLSISAKAQSHFSINGKVSNYSKDFALFKYDTTGYGLSYVVDTIKIDKDGLFKIEAVPSFFKAYLDFDDTKPFSLTIPSLITKPVKIVLDRSEPVKVAIEGEQAAFIQYYLDQHKYFAEIYYKKMPKQQSGPPSDAYYAIQDTITHLRIAYLEKYFKGSGLPGIKQFVNKERNNLLYTNLYYRIINEKPDIIKQLAFYQKAKGPGSNHFLTFSDKVDFSNKELFQIENFRSFFNYFIIKAVHVANTNKAALSNEIFLNQGFNLIDKYFKTPQTNALQKLSYLNHQLIDASISQNGINIAHYQKAINELRNNNFVKNYLPPVESKLQELSSSLYSFSEGTKAPNFTVYDKNQKPYSLSTFTGKLVVIDVWASWCGPCLSAFPQWTELIKNNANKKDVVFLSLSVDNDSGKWIKALEKFKPSGIELYGGAGGLESPFSKAFKINSLPTHIVIDQKGNFIAFHSSFADAQKSIDKYTSTK